MPLGFETPRTPVAIRATASRNKSEQDVQHANSLIRGQPQRRGRTIPANPIVHAPPQEVEQCRADRVSAPQYTQPTVAPILQRQQLRAVSLPWIPLREPRRAPRSDNRNAANTTISQTVKTANNSVPSCLFLPESGRQLTLPRAATANTLILPLYHVVGLDARSLTRFAPF